MANSTKYIPTELIFEIFQFTTNEFKVRMALLFMLNENSIYMRTKGEKKMWQCTVKAAYNHVICLYQTEKNLKTSQHIEHLYSSLFPIIITFFSNIFQLPT